MADAATGAGVCCDDDHGIGDRPVPRCLRGWKQQLEAAARELGAGAGAGRAACGGRDTFRGNRLQGGGQAASGRERGICNSVQSEPACRAPARGSGERWTLHAAACYPAWPLCAATGSGFRAAATPRSVHARPRPRPLRAATVSDLRPRSATSVATACELPRSLRPAASMRSPLRPPALWAAAPDWLPRELPASLCPPAHVVGEKRCGAP